MSNADDTPEYRTEEIELPVQYDPDLQRVVIENKLNRSGVELIVRADCVAGAVVDVIAKLRNPEVSVPGLRVSTRIGPIVTGTVHVDNIEEVRKHSNVLSLKAARRLDEVLFVSVPQIQAARQQLQTAFIENGSIDGSGVIIGLVDHGCDFVHHNFRQVKRYKKKNRSTRVLYLWDQRGGCNNDLRPGYGKSPEPFGYGREFNSDAINTALEHELDDPLGPYRYLNYTPREAAHGTGVMDIATGNGGGKFAPGVAPGADIIFVDSSVHDDYLSGESFGSSSRLVDAVAYIFDKAEERGQAAVVNISLNYEAGPHDGSTLVEEGFDRLLLEKPGRAIVIAAGNSRLRQIHVRRTLYTQRAHNLVWQIGEDLTSRNKLDLWYDGTRAISLRLKPPGKAPLGPFSLGSTHIIYRNDAVAGFVFHRANDPNNHDNNLVLAFTPLMEAGPWELELTLLDDASGLPLEVHAWAETDRQRSFFAEALSIDSACTLGTLGCGSSTIVVGGYNAANPSEKFGGSGEGPTRDGKLKPEVSAPAVRVNAARARTNSVAPVSGTSAAAPHVTGLIALLLQAEGKYISIDQIRERVISHARTEPAQLEPGWDGCYGGGCVDAVGTLQKGNKDGGRRTRRQTNSGRTKQEIH